MGIFKFGGQAREVGLPEELVLALARKLGSWFFIETGTGTGRTTEWASRYFQRCITIDADPTFLEGAKTRLQGKAQNIDFVLGESSEALEQIVPSLNAPAVFWLDAHWVPDNASKVTPKNPLPRELFCISQSPYEHLVLIDDARYLYYPTYFGTSYEWPGINEIVQTLQCGRIPYQFFLLGDCFVAVPRNREIIEIIDNYRVDGVTPHKEQNPK